MMQPALKTLRKVADIDAGRFVNMISNELILL